MIAYAAPGLMLASALLAHGGQFRGPAALSVLGSGQSVEPPVPALDTNVHWQHWWEFRKSEWFPDPRDRQPRRPIAADRDAAVAALTRACRVEQHHVTPGAMIALAKLRHDPAELLPLFRAKLASKDQQIREAAALAMGLLRDEDAITDLIALARDSTHGRSLCDRTELTKRDRAFAAWGLVAIAERTSHARFRRALIPTFAGWMHGDVPSSVAVAAVWGLARLGGDGLPALTAAWNGPCQPLAHAHLPTAIAAALATGDTKSRREWIDRFAAELGRRVPERGDRILELDGESPAEARRLTISLAVALGRLGAQELATADDRRAAVEGLIRVDEGPFDLHTRALARIALGRVGGERARTHLTRTLEDASDWFDRVWPALAIGVLGREHGSSAALTAPLRAALEATAHPDEQAALAIGLALLGDRASAPAIRAMLERERHKDDLSSSLCQALALLDDTESTASIRKLAAASMRRPSRLMGTILALGLLARPSDQRSLRTPLELLRKVDSTNRALHCAFAQAIGHSRDRALVEPLIEILGDAKHPDVRRSTAAAALGCLLDPDPMPWNERWAIDVNYRALDATLSNQIAGIFDLL